MLLSRISSVDFSQAIKHDVLGLELQKTQGNTLHRITSEYMMLMCIAASTGDPHAKRVRVSEDVAPVVHQAEAGLSSIQQLQMGVQHLAQQQPQPQHGSQPTLPQQERTESAHHDSTTTVITAPLVVNAVFVEEPIANNNAPNFKAFRKAGHLNEQQKNVLPLVISDIVQTYEETEAFLR